MVHTPISRGYSVTKLDPALSRIMSGQNRQTISPTQQSHNQSVSDTDSSPLITDTSHTEINDSELSQKLTNVVKERVCEKYKRGKCPHGLKGKKEHNGQICEFEHPKYCVKYCRNGTQQKFGCNRGSNCKFCHPVLCKFSVKSKLCTNSDCTFIHLKGTRRKENGASREVTDTRAVPPKNNSKPHSATNSTDHFLELKRLVDTMQSSFLREIADIRSSLHPYPQYHFPRHPLQPGTAIPQYHHPYQQQFLPAPNMPIIPHVSC